MIITQWKDQPPLVVGQRYEHTLTDANRVEHEHTPYVVLRQATWEEYVAWCLSHGIKRGEINTWREQHALFYEVSVD